MKDHYYLVKVTRDDYQRRYVCKNGRRMSWDYMTPDGREALRIDNQASALWWASGVAQRPENAGLDVRVVRVKIKRCPTCGQKIKKDTNDTNDTNDG